MNGWSSPRIIPTSATERSEGMRLAYTWVGRPSTSSVTTSNIPPGPVSWARTSSIVGMGGTVAARQPGQRKSSVANPCDEEEPSMKIFLAGGTGVVGTRALPALVAAGHDVTAVARTDAKAELVRSLRGEPVTVDLFDADAVAAAVVGHEVVVNLATSIPPLTKAARGAAWATNERLRSEASNHLVDGALAAGAVRYVQESIAFPYVDNGDRWIDEDHPVEQVGPFSGARDAEAAAARFAEHGVGVVLRFAQFYAPDSSHTMAFNATARRRINPFLGSPEGYTSFIHAEDAGSGGGGGAAGTERDVQRGRRRAGDACRGGPDPRRGVRRQGAPHRAQGGAGRHTSIGQAAHAILARVEPPLQGSHGLAARPPVDPRGVADVTTLHKVALVVIAAGSLIVGIWAQGFPRSFYDDFPGMGRVWVAVDGPFNEHLVRDVGGLNLALAFVAVMALVSGSTLLARVTGGAALLYGVPHLLYHATHRDPYDTGDVVAMLTSLSVSVLAAILLLTPASDPDPAAPPHQPAGEVPQKAALHPQLRRGAVTRELVQGGRTGRPAR